MNTLPFDAIIFDHDGTLIDTETPDFEACQILCREHGFELPVEQWAASVVGRIDGYDQLFDDLLARNSRNGLTRADLYHRMRQLWPITLQSTQLMPGVETLLPNLRKEGYRLAVATASDRGWVTRWLTTFNLLPYFEILSTGDTVTHNKPAPDVYLQAAAALAVSPRRCLVFEDSLVGVQAAKAAGMIAVAVPTPVTRTLDFSQADHILTGLEHVTVDWIASLGSLPPKELG